MGDVIQGPWRQAPQHVPSLEPSDVDRLIIQEVNRLCSLVDALSKRVTLLEGAGGHDVRP